MAQLSLPELRQFYMEAGENRAVADEFMDYMDSTNIETPLMLAYFASAQAFLAKHSKYPVKKLKYIKLATRSFEKAIAMDSIDAEVRFLRFAVQHNLPKFLGLSGELEIDKSAVIKYLEKTDSVQKYPDWQATIVNFMIDSDRCTADEINQFKKLLN